MKLEAFEESKKKLATGWKFIKSNNEYIEESESEEDNSEEYILETEVKKDAKTVKESLEYSTESFDLDTSELYKVCDGAQVNQKAFGEWFIYCACHRLNLVDILFWALLCITFPEVAVWFSTIKKIIAYFRRTGNSELLKNKLYTESKTRFSSRVFQIESFHKSFNEIRAILHKKSLTGNESGVKYYPMLLDINPTRISEIVDFLSEVNFASEELSPGTHPTIHKVIQIYDFLRHRHCSISIGDSSFQQKMCSLFIEALDKKFPTIFKRPHFLSILLNPMIRTLSPAMLRLPGYKQKQKSIIKYIKKYIKDFNQSKNETEEMVQDEFDFIMQPQKKKRKSFSERLFEMCESEIAKGPECEYELYDNIVQSLDVNSTHEERREFNRNPLQFYRKYSDRLPALTHLARQTFCIPAASTSSERVFSTSKENLQGKRGNKKYSRLQTEIFLGSYYRAFDA